MSQAKKVVSMPSTSNVKRNFQNDITDVRITLPVNFDISLNLKCCVTFIDKQDRLINYFFDYLPNVDINCYIQFAAQKYNYNVPSDTSKSDKSL